MSHGDVDRCKQVYDSPSVCWLLYATGKECIRCGTERKSSTTSNMLKWFQFRLTGNMMKCIYTVYCTCGVQLTQWRHFEEDQNNPTQMAKYFSSPSRSQPSVYSQEEIYYLLGENSSMKKLLSEVTHY